ncbi:SsgA family sporulation/cell division regulator [Streptomyces canus]|uniref:SsgA family sporulation/cell division regulator n=1 Tax=Streptomyces canus TaxID=58343 RepID=UPI003717EA7F
MSDRIDHRLDTKLVLPFGERISIPSVLSYRTDDPFAVHLIFHADTEHTISWAFDRNLLAGGLCRPCGPGDVYIWPTGMGSDAELHLVLSSPHGTARLVAPLPVLAQWLDRTYALVPAGQETDGWDVDAELSLLLHGAA